MKKTEMTKLQRKRLERELIRNRRQRKENHRDMKRLESADPAYYTMIKLRRKFVIVDDEEELSFTSVQGEALRGIRA